MTQLPKRVQVIRLFNEDEIDNEKYDPRKVPIDSEYWIPTSFNNPHSSTVFFVKNDNLMVSKAIYIGSLPYPTPSKWYHTFIDEYISDYEIMFWMDMKNYEKFI